MRSAGRRPAVLGGPPSTFTHHFYSHRSAVFNREARSRRRAGDASTRAACAPHATAWGTAEEELQRLHEQLREGTYRPQPVRRAWIDQPGSKEKRPLGIPAVRDRIVQGALRHVLEPLFETDFAEHSYGFRPGRSEISNLKFQI